MGTDYFFKLIFSSCNIYELPPFDNTPAIIADKAKENATQNISEVSEKRK